MAHTKLSAVKFWGGNNCTKCRGKGCRKCYGKRWKFHTKIAKKNKLAELNKWIFEPNRSSKFDYLRTQ